MKNRKFTTLIIYAVILILLLSWGTDLFGLLDDSIPYSQAVQLIREEKVKSFIIQGSTMEMVLHEPVDGRGTVSATAADPDGFLRELQTQLQQQLAQFRTPL